MRQVMYTLLLALQAGGFTPHRAPRPPKTVAHGIANFGTFFAESWLGAGACSSRNCPPSKDAFDHVLIDVNQYVHTSARRATSQEDAVRRLYAALDGVLKVARPRKSLVLALDGAAPVAKIVTQRKRREANVAKTGVQLANEVHPLLITPGTVFMDVISDALESYAIERVSRRRTLENVTVYTSCVRAAGEGELKLVRWLRSSACDGGTAAVVSGDADVVLQALAALDCTRKDLEPFVLRPFVKGAYGIVSAWRLGRELAKRFPTASADRSRDDVLVLLLLQGNDYVPKLRAAPFHACLKAYERAVQETSGEEDAAHFFRYDDLGVRQGWHAAFASQFFDHLQRNRPRPAQLYDSYDLRDLHERNQTGAITELTFELVEGAASPDEWRCEATCKQLRVEVTAPTKQKAKRLAATHILEHLGETEWPNGDPICALGNRASLRFRTVTAKRQWVCDASLQKDGVFISASAAAGSKREARASAAELLRKEIAPDTVTSRTSDAPSYVRGLAWCLDAYIEGEVKDGSYRYLKPHAPSAKVLKALFEEGVPAEMSVTTSRPLSADVHCCAVMPREASSLLPDHLQPLHAAICDARDRGLDADALPFLEALASTLFAANSLLGGGDDREWSTVRRARPDELTLDLVPPMPRPGGGTAMAQGGGARVSVAHDVALMPAPIRRGGQDLGTEARTRANRELLDRRFYTAFSFKPRDRYRPPPPSALKPNATLA